MVKPRSHLDLSASGEDEDDHYFKPLLQVSASSPTTPEPLPRISLTPSPKMGWQNLPGVSEMLDGALYRRTVSVPGHCRSRSVSIVSSQRAPVPGFFGIVPVPQLLNPYDSVRVSAEDRELPPPMVSNSNLSTPYLDRTTPTLSHSSFGSPYLDKTPPVTISSSNHTSPYLDRTPPSSRDGMIRPMTHRSHTAPLWQSPHLKPQTEGFEHLDRTSVHALLNHERSTTI